MFFVYILKSKKDDSYYVGSTADLQARIIRHNQGRNKYTKSKLPWKVVHTEEYKSRSEATEREKEIKNKKSRRYIEYLITNWSGSSVG